MAPVTDKREPTLRASALAIPILVIWIAAEAWSQQTEPEKLIAAGHWKRARGVVQARFHQTPDDPLGNFLLSQIHNAFGDFTTPLALAEKAVALDGRVAKYHRQLAEVLGVEAQHGGPIQLLFLARRFRSEIDTAIALDPRDVQALRDLLEFYLVAPGLGGGDPAKAVATAERIAEIDASEAFLAQARIASFHKETKQTEALLLKAAQAQPPSYRARVELAKFYLAGAHTNPGAAENAAREILKFDRTRVDAYAILAEVYANRADWNALEAILAEASQQVPDDLTPYYRAADALLTDRRAPPRAERYLHTYLSQEPEGNEPPGAEARRKLDQALQAEAQGRRTGTVAERKDPGGLNPQANER